jgi:hypothetical protein
VTKIGAKIKLKLENIPTNKINHYMNTTLKKSKMMANPKLD